MKQITVKEWFGLTIEEREEVVKTLGEVMITLPKKWHTDLVLSYEEDPDGRRYEGFWCEFTGECTKKLESILGMYKFQTVYTMLKGPEWMTNAL